MKLSILGGVGLIVTVIIMFAMWQIKREFNYSWGYESRVKSSICEMAENGAITKGPNWGKYCG